MLKTQSQYCRRQMTFAQSVEVGDQEIPSSSRRRHDVRAAAAVGTGAAGGAGAGAGNP